MSKVILTGSTGMIGGLLREHCLNSPEVTQLVCPVRKSTGIQHPKLTELIVEDFLNIKAEETWLHEVAVVFFCIGVYTGAVDRDLFRKITVDYPVKFAVVLHRYSPNARFCLLSGAGADRTEKSRISFARDKGAAENALSALNFGAFHAFRPSYIYPVERRREPNFSYRIFRFIYPLVKYMGKKYSIKSTELAEAMFHVGMNGSELEIFENIDIIEVLES